MIITGIEANALLYALDAYMQTNSRGQVQCGDTAGLTKVEWQELRNRLFIHHEHPRDNEIVDHLTMLAAETESAVAYFDGLRTEGPKHRTRLQWELGHAPGMPEHLGTRAYNALHSHFETFAWGPAEVEAIGVTNLLRVPNMGKKSVEWVKNWLTAHGRKIKP